jgi:hypothetical protein
MGEVENVCFRSLPGALRVVGLPISPPLPGRAAALKMAFPVISMRRAGGGGHIRAGQALIRLITPGRTKAGHRTHASHVTDLTPKSLRTFALDSCD